MSKNNRLVYKGGRWYENGKYLPKKDYIFHASAHDQESIYSCRTNERYRLRGDRRVSYIL